MLSLCLPVCLSNSFEIWHDMLCHTVLFSAIPLTRSVCLISLSVDAIVSAYLCHFKSLFFQHTGYPLFLSFILSCSSYLAVRALTRSNIVSFISFLSFIRSLLHTAPPHPTPPPPTPPHPAFPFPLLFPSPPSPSPHPPPHPPCSSTCHYGRSKAAKTRHHHCQVTARLGAKSACTWRPGQSNRILQQGDPPTHRPTTLILFLLSTAWCSTITS